MSAGGHARAQRLSTEAGTTGQRASLCRGTLPLATTLGEEVLTLGHVVHGGRQHTSAATRVNDSLPVEKKHQQGHITPVKAQGPARDRHAPGECYPGTQRGAAADAWFVLVIFVPGV